MTVRHLTEAAAAFLRSLPADDPDAADLRAIDADVAEAEARIAELRATRWPLYERLDRRAVWAEVFRRAEATAREAGAVAVPREAVVAVASNAYGSRFATGWTAPLERPAPFAVLLRRSWQAVFHYINNAGRVVTTQVQLRLKDGREKGARGDGPVFIDPAWLATLEGEQ